MKIGVVLHRDPRETLGRTTTSGIGQEPGPTRIGDSMDWTNVYTITAMGAPVYGHDPSLGHDAYRTGLTWTEFRQGRREKFRSESEQNDVLRLLPHLLSAVKGGIRSRRRAQFVLSDELKVEIANGDLIEGG